jgi:hypothetical protein
MWESLHVSTYGYPWPVTGIALPFYLFGFEVLTAVVINSSILWDTKPCSPMKSVEVSEEYIASIFSVKISRTRNQCERRWQAERRRYAPSKYRLTFKELHGVSPQKIGLSYMFIFYLTMLSKASDKRMNN